MDPNPQNCLIKKKVLHAGNSYQALSDGCKVTFHFQTRKTDKAKTLIDDSRAMGKNEPMVLVLGKKFKLEVWEVVLKKMAVGEIAQFTVDKSLVVQYPFISKTLRGLGANNEEKRTHFCAATLQNEGIGHADLNALLTNPVDLEFTIDLIQVEYPDDYEKDAWQLTDADKIKIIPELKEKGNTLFSEKNYSKAADAYSEAIGYLEQLMLKEKPHDVEWVNFNNLKIPLLLNFSQCKLFEGDFYAVIEHCSTVLESEPDNIKALYRRAKAYKAAWSPTAAINDFLRLKDLDPSLTASIDKELKELKELQKERDVEDKMNFKNLFISAK